MNGVTETNSEGPYKTTHVNVPSPGPAARSPCCVGWETVGTDRLAGHRTRGSWCPGGGVGIRRAGRWGGGWVGRWAEGIVPAAPARQGGGSTPRQASLLCSSPGPRSSLGIFLWGPALSPRGWMGAGGPAGAGSLVSQRPGLHTHCGCSCHSVEPGSSEAPSF